MKNVEINKNTKLSEHMTLGELTVTSVKTADGNIPSHVAIENLKRVCKWLEELRYSYNTLYLIDIADDTDQDFDELLLEHGSNGVIWLHFAVRPPGQHNRRRINFLQG